MAALSVKNQPRRVVDIAVRKLIRSKVPMEPADKLMHICPATTLLFAMDRYHYRVDPDGIYGWLMGFEHDGMKYQILYLDRNHMYVMRMKVSRKHMPFVLQCKVPCADPTKMNWLQIVDTWEYQGKTTIAQDMFWRVMMMNVIQMEIRPSCALDVSCAVMKTAETALDDTDKDLVFVPTSYAAASRSILYDPNNLKQYAMVHPPAVSIALANGWGFKP